MGPPLRMMLGRFVVAAVMSAAGVVLSQPVVKDDAIKRIGVNDLHHAQIREIAVQRGVGRRTVSWMGCTGKNKRKCPPASRTPALARSNRFQMDSVHGVMSPPVCEMPINGPTALELFARQAVVHHRST